MTDYQEKLSTIVQAAVHGYSADMKISPAIISKIVYEEIDPERVSPTLVEYGCIMQIRVVARLFLKEKYESKDDSGQGELSIGGIQERYPMEDGTGYVHIDYLPKSDLDYNVMRLRKYGNALLDHADALEAKGQEFEDSGHYSTVDENK